MTSAVVGRAVLTVWGSQLHSSHCGRGDEMRGKAREEGSCFAHVAFVWVALETSEAFRSSRLLYHTPRIGGLISWRRFGAGGKKRCNQLRGLLFPFPLFLVVADTLSRSSLEARSVNTSVFVNSNFSPVSRDSPVLEQHGAIKSYFEQWRASLIGLPTTEPPRSRASIGSSRAVPSFWPRSVGRPRGSLILR